MNRVSLPITAGILAIAILFTGAGALWAKWGEAAFLFGATPFCL